MPAMPLQEDTLYLIYNFASGEFEPKTTLGISQIADFSNYVPQDKESQQMFKTLQESGDSPNISAQKVLKKYAEASLLPRRHS